MPTPIKHIIIVGAGPSGLLLGVLLARLSNNSPNKIRITLLEAANALDTRPRAAYYGPSAVPVLERAGVLDDVRTRGFSPKWMTWRKLWHPVEGKPEGEAEILGRIDLDSGADRMACLPLDELGKVFLEHLAKHGNGNVEIVWGARVVDIGEEAGQAWVDVELADSGEGTKREKRERYHADFVVGCDGASSAVRRKLFGDKNYPGITWDKQVVATNVRYDFTKYGYEDVQFFIHPEHWHMVARLASPEQYWRVSYGVPADLTAEELLDRLPAKFEAMLPGHPKPGEYNVAGFSPYKTHQRLSPSMRVGRFLLAADAAHLCNPFGGLGLTGGIVDIGGLHDCLAGIHNGRADDSILDLYSDVRRQKWTDIIDPVSSENIRRLFDQDPEEAPEKDDFIRLIRQAEQDLEVARVLQEGMHAIGYDFTQHYSL